MQRPIRTLVFCCFILLLLYVGSYYVLMRHGHLATLLGWVSPSKSPAGHSGALFVPGGPLALPAESGHYYPRSGPGETFYAPLVWLDTQMRDHAARQACLGRWTLPDSADHVMLEEDGDCHFLLGSYEADVVAREETAHTHYAAEFPHEGRRLTLLLWMDAPFLEDRSWPIQPPPLYVAVMDGEHTLYSRTLEQPQQPGVP